MMDGWSEVSLLGLGVDHGQLRIRGDAGREVPSLSEGFDPNVPCDNERLGGRHVDHAWHFARMVVESEGPANDFYPFALVLLS